MYQAFMYIFDIWGNLLKWLLNEAIIPVPEYYGSNNVINISFGYIIIACIILSILIRNVLAIPSKGQSYTFKGGKNGNS